MTIVSKSLNRDCSPKIGFAWVSVCLLVIAYATVLVLVTTCCCMWFKKDSYVPIHIHHDSKPHTPLPKQRFMCIICALLGTAVLMAIVYPFMPFQIEYFKIATSHSEISFYVGIVESALPLGQFLTVWIWGAVSDRIGRKPLILMSMLTNCIAGLVYGFASSFWVALAARFFQGCFDASLPLIRSYIMASTDTTNRSYGFAVYGFVWGTTVIFSSTVGGWLSQPTEKFALFAGNEFFEKYPYSLPLMIASGICFVSFLVCLFFMEDSVDHSEARLSLSAMVSSYKQLCTNSVSFRVALLSFLLYTCVFFCDELFPVFAATPVELRGLGWHSGYIGFAQLFGGVSNIIIVLLFPSLHSRFGIINISTVMFGLICCVGLFFPYLYNLSLIAPSIIIMAFAALGPFVRSLFVGSVTASHSMLIANTHSKALFGAANGLATTGGSIGAIVGPFLGTTLFSLSLHGLIMAMQAKSFLAAFPLEKLSYLLLATASSLGACIFLSLPRDSEHKHEN